MIANTKLTEYFEQNFPGLKAEKYFVDDLISETDDLIFVLESPYREELKTMRPLSGKSGNNFNVVISNIRNLSGSPYSIGLMESCPFPMDRKAYDSQVINALENSLLEIKDMENSNKLNGKHEDFKLFVREKLRKSAVMNHYTERIELFQQKKTRLVICGFIAQAFFEEFTNLRIKEGYTKYFQKWGKWEENELIYLSHPKNWNIEPQLIQKHLTQNGKFGNIISES